ncbi:protein of unknown function [Candidatus Nitrosocosmicus franklandus]|uniref:Uncharacterized protein n=1 Tax=Candidatus Nitrosocosmicus franklandianus TaxID=1798806 RepID=A0A484IAF9_9ARCH|nr:protein of unknown function [Candidatus Nitrosocosmicus franklandus]
MIIVFDLQELNLDTSNKIQEINVRQRFDVLKSISKPKPRWHQGIKCKGRVFVQFAS